MTIHIPPGPTAAGFSPSFGRKSQQFLACLRRAFRPTQLRRIVACVLPVEILGKPASQAQEAHLEFVSSEYFTSLRIPFPGPLWDQGEIARGAGLILVNQAFVRRYMAGGDALGHSVRVPQFATLPPMGLTANGATGWLPIIGVVADSLDDGLDKPVAPAVYAPYTLLTPPVTQVLVRTPGEPLALLHSIRDKSLPLIPITDLRRCARPRRLDSARTGVCEGSSHLHALRRVCHPGAGLAAVGLYSVSPYGPAAHD